MATMVTERPKAQPDIDDRRRMHAYFDEKLRDIGERAPQPFSNQPVDDYVRETCRSLKRTHLPEDHPLRQANFRGLRADALYTFVPQLLEAIVKEANDPKNVPFGQFKAIQEFDNYGARKSLRFIGQEHFTKFMGRPGRRVLSFTTDRGRFDASGRALR